MNYTARSAIDYEKPNTVVSSAAVNITATALVDQSSIRTKRQNDTTMYSAMIMNQSR